MIAYLLIKYCHYLSILMVFAGLLAEVIILKPQHTRAEIKSQAKYDGLYGLGAILVVGIGLTLWYGVGKPAEYYSNNWIFLTKFGLFTLIGLLSIAPTIFFLKNRKGDQLEVIEIPRYIKPLVIIELILLLIMPLLAVLMANGYGSMV